MTTDERLEALRQEMWKLIWSKRDLRAADHLRPAYIALFEHKLDEQSERIKKIYANR